MRVSATSLRLRATEDVVGDLVADRVGFEKDGSVDALLWA